MNADERRYEKQNMKQILLSIMGLLFAASVAEAKLNVVATTADLGAIAKEIGGNDIDLTTLGKPTEDGARSPEAVPRQARR